MIENSHSFFTSDAEDYLIRDLLECYDGDINDIYNLLDSITERAYNRGKDAEFDKAFEAGVEQGQQDEFDRRENMRF